jgi:hypothetical protein
VCDFENWSINFKAERRLVVMRNFVSKVCHQKPYTVSFHNQGFHLSLEELSLIAPKLVKFYQKNKTHFILLSEESNKNSQLFQAMEGIVSLFFTETQIELNIENEQAFSFLASKFNNHVLRKALNFIPQTKAKVFFKFSKSFSPSNSVFPKFYFNCQ